MSNEIICPASTILTQILTYNLGLPYACQCARDHSSLAGLSLTHEISGREMELHKEAVGSIPANAKLQERICKVGPRAQIFDGR